MGLKGRGRVSGLRHRPERLSTRRYSNILDLPGVGIARRASGNDCFDAAGESEHDEPPAAAEEPAGDEDHTALINVRMDQQQGPQGCPGTQVWLKSCVSVCPQYSVLLCLKVLDLSTLYSFVLRFFQDFRPFFLLCQLCGIFPNRLQWNLPFVWCYWGTFICLFNLFMMCFLFMFYVSQTVQSIINKDGMLHVIYNISWVIHVIHAIDWIVNFFHDRKLFVQIFQGYRKFYRYLLADMSDKSVIKFTWKTFVSWEIMFYCAAAALVLKSYYDRFGTNNVVGFEMSEAEEKKNAIKATCAEYGYLATKTVGTNRSLLATVDQLDWMQATFSQELLDVIFWIHLVANIICLNVTFLSEVFFMVMISVIFHAFIFIHKQIDGLLGNPDSVFNINVVHEPLENAETQADHIVRKELKGVHVQVGSEPVTLRAYLVRAVLRPTAQRSWPCYKSTLHQPRKGLRVGPTNLLSFALCCHGGTEGTFNII
jgi:hypothetical protein